MNCDVVVQLLLTGEALTPEAREHLRSCPDCRVAELYRKEDGDGLRPEVRDRLAALVQENLAPVSPLRPRTIYQAALLGGAALVIAAGIGILGHRGWTANHLAGRLLVGGTICAALVFAAVLLARFMTPGTLLRVRPGAFALAVCALLAFETALYPLAVYAQFVKALAACFTIGLVHAIPTMVFAMWVLRRGAVVAPVPAAMTAGLFSGLTGLAVLFIFCPHLDLGHYLLAHVGMTAACTALAPLAAGVFRAGAR